MNRASPAIPGNYANMTEQELVGCARGGDQAAFAVVVARFQAPIFNLCYRMLGEASEAEDAAQESFLRAYSQLQRYDPTRPFKSWLFSIANHYCIDRLRRRRLTWLDIEDEALASHPLLCEVTPGPEEAAIQHEQDAAVQSLLSKLSPDNRSALILRYWYGMSYDEIAAATRTSVSAVKSRLHRARETLAETISPAPSQPGHPAHPRPTAPAAV